MPTSLDRSDSKGQIVHLRSIACHFGENLIKIGPVDSEIIGLQWMNDVAILGMVQKVSNSTLINSIVTGPKFIKFSHVVAASSSNCFWNARVYSGVSQVYFWCQKLTGYHSNVPVTTAKWMSDLSFALIGLPNLKIWCSTFRDIWRKKFWLSPLKLQFLPL